MTYELAKQLKDAGFPQATWFYYRKYRWKDASQRESELCEPYIGMGTDGWLDCIAAPTLSELIEACGDGFTNLHHWNGTHAEEWVCNFKNYPDGFAWTTAAPTREEAVARLWISLNKS
jgi:hypothetical protein